MFLGRLHVGHTGVVLRVSFPTNTPRPRSGKIFLPAVGSEPSDADVFADISHLTLRSERKRLAGVGWGGAAGLLVQLAGEPLTLLLGDRSCRRQIAVLRINRLEPCHESRIWGERRSKRRRKEAVKE